jgi:hypothetical protein
LFDCGRAVVCGFAAYVLGFDTGGFGFGTTTGLSAALFFALGGSAGFCGNVRRLGT